MAHLTFFPEMCLKGFSPPYMQLYDTHFFFGTIDKITTYIIDKKIFSGKCIKYNF